MTDRKPTDEQLACIEAAGRPDSIMMTAYAGTGKSSTLEMMAPQIKQPALALAFNKKIVEELKPRLPDNFIVKSLNGLGHGAWMRRPGMPRLQLDDRKLGKLITLLAKESNMKLSSEQWDWARQLVTKAQLEGLVPQKFQSQASPFAKEASFSVWADCALEVGIPSDEIAFLSQFAEEVLIRDIELALQGQISFDDQIYCPTILGGQWPRYPEVFIDESQDLSPLNHQMLSLCLRDKLTAVGDPLQAIYAFRGADSNSMTNLRKLRESWIDRPLTMTFRCPKTIVARQQSHARGYRAFEGNREGSFIQSEPYDEMAGKGGWSLGDLKRWSNGATDITILCRNNGPLLSLAFKLLRQGIGVKMLGRDIGKNLISLSKKLCPTDEMTREACAAAISKWMQDEISLATANQRENLADSIQDRGECLLAVLESAEARDAGQLRRLLEQLFSRDSGLVTLSSIHRSKGLEWSCVVHLDPWRIPSKWARKAAEEGNESQLKQEYNLRYVCETRTKDLLINVNLEDFHS